MNHQEDNLSPSLRALLAEEAVLDEAPAFLGHDERVSLLQEMGDIVSRLHAAA